MNLRKALFLGTFLIITALCLYGAAQILFDHCNNNKGQNEQNAPKH